MKVPPLKGGPNLRPKVQNILFTYPIALIIWILSSKVEDIEA